VQGGVERAGIDSQDFAGIGADGFAQGVAVPGGLQQSLENEHIEGALEDFGAILVAAVLRGHGWYVDRLLTCR
jgi:hypothetical protein